MVRIAATITRSNSIRVIARKPMALVMSRISVDDSADGELPLEPEPDVDQDHHQADTERQQAIAEQFRRHRGAHRIGAQHLHPRYRLFQAQRARG